MVAYTVVSLRTGDSGQAARYGSISRFPVSSLRNAERWRDAAARYVPLDRLLVETDRHPAGPPTKRQENQPALVRDALPSNGSREGVSFEQLAQQTTDNFATLFLSTRPFVLLSPALLF